MLALAAIVNVIVDPYRVFRIIDAAGFNARKPRAMEQGYLSKLAAVTAIRPQRLIVGNSRAEVGLDPRSPQWGDNLLTYNAALPGTGPETALEFMRVARKAGHLKEVIVGLDFLDFLVRSSAADNGSTESIPMVADPRSHRSKTPRLDLATLATLALSLDALEDSIRTVATQKINTLPDLTPAGFNPMRDYAAMARRDGYGAFFRQRDQENAAAYLRDPKSIFERGTRSSPEWQAVDAMATLCDSLERGCVFVIYPYHAHILELFRLTGLDDLFDAWKPELLRRLAASENASSLRSRGKLTLWDFSGYNRYSCEEVPALGDLTHVVRWYWEAGHFKRELGDIMIARIQGHGPAEFGTRVPTEINGAESVRLHRGDERCGHRSTDTTQLRAIVKRLQE